MSEYSDAIPEAVEEFLAIYKEKLSDVAFPDVSLEIFNGLIDKVHNGVKSLEAAEKQVVVAQESLNAANDELQQKCQKALAYAKIFADDQEELSERLASISFSKPVRTPRKAAPVDKVRKGTAASKPVSLSETDETAENV